MIAGDFDPAARNYDRKWGVLLRMGLAASTRCVLQVNKSATSQDGRNYIL